MTCNIASVDNCNRTSSGKNGLKLNLLIKTILFALACVFISALNIVSIKFLVLPK